MELYINTQGLVRAIYGEVLPLQSLGRMQIERASQVEPDDTGNWWADLELSGGPTLGPFLLRSTALDAEQEWLTRHLLDPTHKPSPERSEPFHDELPRPPTLSPSESPAETAFQTPSRRPHLSQ